MEVEVEALGSLELCMCHVPTEEKYTAGPGRVERRYSSDTQALCWLGIHSLIACKPYSKVGAGV